MPSPTMTAKLPIEQMLRDADDAWGVHVGTQKTAVSPDLIGDLACHVRALAAEVADLETRNAALVHALREALDMERYRE